MSDRSLCVLVVDDSRLQQQQLQALLAEHGCRFVTADDGAAGILAAREHRPDIILMDIEMPVMDGLEAAQRIRDDADIADIPIVMVTSRAEVEFMESAFVGGCNDYITKPVHQEELLAKIASLTGMPGEDRA